MSRNKPPNSDRKVLLSRLVHPRDRRKLGWFHLADVKPEPDETVLVAVLYGDAVFRIWHPPGPMLARDGDFAGNSGSEGWWEELTEGRPEDGGSFTYWMPLPRGPSFNPATEKVEDPERWEKRAGEEGGDHLYIIQSRANGAVKIGRSDRPRHRVRELQTGSPYRLRLLLISEWNGIREAEVHRLLERHRLKGVGEWFEPNCLQDLPEDLRAEIDLEDAERWWRAGVD